MVVKNVNGFTVSMSTHSVVIYKKVGDFNISARKDFSYEGNVINEFNGIKSKNSIKNFINSAHQTQVSMV